MNVYETIKEGSSNLESLRKKFQVLIQDEQNAIIGYEKILSSLHFDLNEEELTKVKEVFNHIIEEEREHIDELEALFKEIKPQ